MQLPVTSKKKRSFCKVRDVWENIKKQPKLTSGWQFFDVNDTGFVFLKSAMVLYRSSRNSEPSVTWGSKYCVIVSLLFGE
jgi:hypothetical protein